MIFNQSQSSLMTLMPLLWQVNSHDQTCLFVGLFESYLSGDPDSDLLSYKGRSQLSGEGSVVWGGASYQGRSQCPFSNMYCLDCWIFAEKINRGDKERKILNLLYLQLIWVWLFLQREESVYRRRSLSTGEGPCGRAGLVQMKESGGQRWHYPGR